MDVKLGKLSPNAKLFKIPIIKHESKTKVYVLNAQPYSYQVRVHSSCICNEMVALCNRHCIDRTYLKFDASTWHRASRIDIPTKIMEKVTALSVVQAYTGGKRKQYRSALISLGMGWLKKYRVVSMFIKPDKYTADGIRDKAPRAIQFRSKEYNIALAQYLKPVEHFLYDAIQCNGTRVIAKGLSPMARGLLMSNKVSLFRSPVYFEVDHSKFDSTIRVEHLKTLHRIYRRFYPNDKRFSMLLSYQINNRGFTKGGIGYKIRGTRMSGDFDTGLGNSLINYITLVAWLKLCKFERFDIILDGDDSVIIVEEKEVGKAQPEKFELFGFETKFKVVYDIHQVDFCQSRFMSVPIPNFVRSPLRTLAHSSIVLKRYSPDIYARWSAGIGLCELSLNPGVPINQMLGMKLAKQRYWMDADTLQRLGNVKCKMKFYPVTDLARYQYFRCFGIEPEMQIIMEQSITAPLYSKQEVQDSVEYVSTTSAVLSTASAYSALGTSISQCWSTVGRNSV